MEQSKECEVYRIFLDYCDWTTGLPEPFESDPDLDFYGKILLDLWYMSFNDGTFLSYPERTKYTVPLMKSIHERMIAKMTELQKMLAEPCKIKDGIEVAILELEGGGEALFWDKEIEPPILSFSPC